jgi:hypothetical protein
VNCTRKIRRPGRQLSDRTILRQSVESQLRGKWSLVCDTVWDYRTRANISFCTVNTALDVTGKPSVDLLSDKERDLCSALRLYPEQYLVIKETMIREFLKSNMLNKAHITKIVKIGTHTFHTIDNAGYYLKSLIHVVFRPC